MQKWQYCILSRTDEKLTLKVCGGRNAQKEAPEEVIEERISDVLHGLGVRGWELISVVNNAPMELSVHYFFKKPIAP